MRKLTETFLFPLTKVCNHRSIENIYLPHKSMNVGKCIIISLKDNTELEKIKNHSNVISIVKKNINGKSKLFVFAKIDEEFEDHWELFINGKYSKYSKKAQNTIISRYKTDKQRNTLRSVFNKDKRMKQYLYNKFCNGKHDRLLYDSIDEVLEKPQNEEIKI